MRRAVTLLLVVTFISFGVWATMPRRTGGAIYLAPAVQHIGPIDLREETAVTATYRLHNDSSRDVTITETSTSCTCTAFDISSYVIPSGAAADIAMRVDVTGMRGRREVSAQLITDHPAFPRFEVLASVDVGTAQDYTTISLSLPSVTAGDEIHHKYETPGVSFRSVSTHTILETVNVSLETDENQRTWLIFDGYAPQAPGLHEARIVAQVDGEIGQCEVVAFIEVKKRFDVSPAGVAFGLLREGRQADRIVRVTGRRGELFREVKLLDQDARISLSDAAFDGNTALLTLRFTAAPGAEFLDSTVTLVCHFSDGRIEHVVLPVSARTLPPD